MLQKLLNQKLWQTIFLIIICFLVIVLIGLLVLKLRSHNANNIILNKFLDSSKDALHIVETTNYWEISPKTCTAQTCSKGVIFYPGASIEAQSYFYKLGFLAQNHKLFATKPLFNLALFNIYHADRIIADNPKITSWAIGDRWLGGIVACEYASQNILKLTSLILINSYCGTDISQTKLKVINIFGNKDILITPEEVNQYGKNLPPSTLNFVIIDMVHGQAGNYGDHSSDEQWNKTDKQVKDRFQQILSTNL